MCHKRVLYNSEHNNIISDLTSNSMQKVSVELSSGSIKYVILEIGDFIDLSRRRYGSMPDVVVQISGRHPPPQRHSCFPPMSCQMNRPELSRRTTSVRCFDITFRWQTQQWWRLLQRKSRSRRLPTHGWCNRFQQVLIKARSKPKCRQSAISWVRWGDVSFQCQTCVEIWCIGSRVHPDASSDLVCNFEKLNRKITIFLFYCNSNNYLFVKNRKFLFQNVKLCTCYIYKFYF